MISFRKVFRLYVISTIAPLKVEAGRFVIVENLESEGEATKSAVRITQNWYEGLRDREQD